MLNKAQKKYARKLARRKTVFQIFKNIKEVFLFLGVGLVVAGPLIGGTWHSVVKEDVKYLFKWMILYVIFFSGWGIYAAIKGAIKGTKNIYAQSLATAEREVDEQNGLEKASITAKFKE